MSCNCGNTIKQDKEEIIRRAKRYAQYFQVNVQVHTWTQRGFSRLYDYEEEGSVDRGKGLLEIIKFQRNKSKDVLPNTETVIGDTDGAETVRKPVPRRIKSKRGKVSTEVGIHDELAKKGKDE